MWKALATAAVVVAFLGACSAGPGSNAGTGQQTNGDISASRVKDYKSVAELRAGSTAVVRATVESSIPGELNDLPITITTVRVNQTLWGHVSSETLAIQQIGNASMRLSDTGRILSKGREYLLFITPFHLKPNDDTGRYLITGDQGNFVFDEGRNRFVFAGAGNPAHLPKSFLKEDVLSGGFLG